MLVWLGIFWFLVQWAQKEKTKMFRTNHSCSFPCVDFLQDVSTLHPHLSVASTYSCSCSQSSSSSARKPCRKKNTSWLCLQGSFWECAERYLTLRLWKFLAHFTAGGVARSVVVIFFPQKQNVTKEKSSSWIASLTDPKNTKFVAKRNSNRCICT